MSVLEYAAKFNEPNHFAPKQVATEEMKMNYFEQGLRGSIKSTIAGHIFDSYQEMYQRAMKIARVLNETKKENKEAILVKRKFEFENKGQKSGNLKRFNTRRPQDKGKKPTPWQNRTPCNSCSRFHYGGWCKGEPVRCYRCGKVGHKVSNRLKAEWNKRKDIEGTGPRTPHPISSQGRPLLPP